MPGRNPVVFRGARIEPADDLLRAIAQVAGRPEWRLLTASRPALPLDGTFAEQAAAALGAWRAHRIEQDRQRRRFETASKDADFLRSVSRRLSEARTLETLLHGDVSEALHEAASFDALVFARWAPAGAEASRT